MKVISLISLFPQFAGHEAGPVSFASIGESQPTRCGHTLRGVHCRGLASGCAPSNPAKAERQKP